MMAQLILLRQYKTFNMKLYFIIVSFLVVGFSNAQVLPQALIVNNNAYPTTISAKASFDLLPVSKNISTNGPFPSIVSDFTYSFNQNTPYTIQFLVKGKSYSSINYSFVLSFAANANLTSDNSNFFINYYIAPGEIHRYNSPSFESNYMIIPNNFSETVQITGTYDGTYFSEYKNGVLVERIAKPAGATWQTAPLRLILGNNNDVTTAQIDEVRFWNKALNADEISNNWNKTLTGFEDGLKLYYNFDNQGYPNENNIAINTIKDNTSNSKATISASNRNGTSQNFVTDISTPIIKDDSIVLSIDANILDSYPGNDHGTNYGNTNNKSAFIVHDLFTTTNLYFYSNSSYNPSQLAAPILNADGGRSFLINNIYGKTNTASFISGNDRRSFEAWVKFNTLNNNSVVSIGDLANNDLFEMAVNNGKLILSTGTQLNGILNIRSQRTLLTNTWYHIVIVCDFYDPNGQFFYIYIDGAIDNDYIRSIYASGIDPYFFPINTTNTTIKIGNSLRPFNGKLGSLKVYKRVLGPTEILNKYNATKSRFGY